MSIATRFQQREFARSSGTSTACYGSIARRLGARIAQRGKDYSAKFPTIKIVDG